MHTEGVREGHHTANVHPRTLIHDHIGVSFLEQIKVVFAIGADDQNLDRRRLHLEIKGENGSIKSRICWREVKRRKKSSFFLFFFSPAFVTARTLLPLREVVKLPAARRPPCS
jgi:hypothetical protein